MGGPTQICFPDVEFGQVLRVREKRVARSNAGRSSFDWRVLDLGQLWYSVKGQEQAQRNSNLTGFDWSVLYLSIFGLGTASSLLKELTSSRVPVTTFLLLEFCRLKILGSRVILRTEVAHTQSFLCKVTQELHESSICFKGAEPVLSWSIWFVCCFPTKLF